MPRVLLTAFKPYAHYRANASWLAVMELTKDFPSTVDLTTRLYPVDYGEMRKHLERDLAEGFDFAVHVGQAPGRGKIALEAIALNAKGPPSEAGAELLPLEPEGPLALKCELPLAAWARMLCEKQIPAEVSYHAGTYLCNAALYYSLLLSAQRKLPTRSAFIHIPLDVTQILDDSPSQASLPATLSAEAIRLLLGQLLLV